MVFMYSVGQGRILVCDVNVKEKVRNIFPYFYFIAQEKNFRMTLKIYRKKGTHKV